MINFEATELRLGLPGDDKGETVKSNGKRGFFDTVDLKLNLSSTATEDELEKMKDNNIKPHAKAQVVGWPPVRSYRKNIMSVKKPAEEAEKAEKASAPTAGLVKVSMDGAPYLRKLDLRLYKTYHELSDALSKMFSTFTHEYIPTYQDKDGDWMLVGDVPWEMFVDSCKRLRIMKEPEAIGPGR